MRADELSGAKVWIAETCYEYEGCTPLGVYATRRRAEKAFEAMTGPLPWMRTPFGSSYSKRGSGESLDITVHTIDKKAD